MPWGINQVQSIFLSFVIIVHLNGMTLYGNATLFFQIHVIKHLCLHIFACHCLGAFQQSVGQCAFSVIYMCYYTKITYMLHISFSALFFFF